MAITNRKTNLDVSVFTLGSAYIDDLENAELSVEVDTDEARALNDQWAYPYATGRKWSIEASLFVAPSAAMVNAILGSAVVAVSFNTGGNQYSGQGLITSAGHATDRGLQKQRVTIEGQGPLVAS